MMKLKVLLRTERLPVKVKMASQGGGAWFDVHSVSDTIGKAYGQDNLGNPFIASLEENAELLNTVRPATTVPHYSAVIKKADGSYYLSDFMFATIEDARRHYSGKTVVKLATEIPGVGLARVV